MNKYSVSLVPVVMFFFLTSSHKKTEQVRKNYDGIGLWTGTLTQDEIIIYTSAAYNGKSVRHVEVSFVNALPTMYRDDPTKDLNFTDDKGTGIHKLHSAVTDVTGRECVGDCSGVGQAELHSVVISESDSTYDIEAIGPDCKGTTCSEDGGVRPYEEGSMISVSNHKLTDKNVLSGSESVTSELPGGFGKATRITTWHLERDKEDDVELIVTPDNYDNWLPEPGIDEKMKGSVMTINLKLQGKNGKPLKVKAESFELRLNNTSEEPGITINYPLSTAAKQLPDLRFLVLSNIESVDEDQFISVSSPDGITGKTYIGSYDGGGWTTLTAEAILEDKRHIKGHLLVSVGDEDILIPKRIPGTKIALAWAKANGNPQDLDDKETSEKNSNNGDGLTAYEEYRGVISEGKFKRLDPQKKELGILVKQSEKDLFAEGFSTFSQASGIDVVLFDKKEIPDNRRLNQNSVTATSFKQYVLRIAKGNISEKDIYGFVMNAYGVAYPHVDIPARVTHIVIDVDRIHSSYQEHSQILGAGNIPYSEKDIIASTVAHEIGHGVYVEHHGDDLPYLNPMTVLLTDTVISDYHGGIIRNRPYTIDGRIGLPGNQQCGDINCVMCYNNRSFWVKENNNVTSIVMFSSLPLLPLGKTFCNDKKGTGINSLGLCYGNAKNGNCLAQIKLRD